MNDVRIAGPEDLAELMILEASFPEGQRWSQESWRGELLGLRRHVLVCEGRSGLDAAATFSLSGDVVDLHRIITSIPARRRGMARQLVDAGIAWAQHAGAARMLLEVEASNTPALSLYETVGFRQISERRDYYGPGLHAVILERRIRAEGVATTEGEPS